MLLSLLFLHIFHICGFISVFYVKKDRLKLQALHVTTVTCSCYTGSRYLYQHVIKDRVFKRHIFTLLYWKFATSHIVCVNSCIQFATAPLSHRSFFFSVEVFGLEFWIRYAGWVKSPHTLLEEWRCTILQVGKSHTWNTSGGMLTTVTCLRVPLLILSVTVSAVRFCDWF